MKRLLLVLLLCLPSHGAVAYVQRIGFAESSSAASLSIGPTTVTAGHSALFCGVNQNGITQTISDSGAGAGNTFVLLPNPPAAFPLDNTSPSARYSMWYVKSLVGGSTTFKDTYGATSSFDAFEGIEVSGTDTTNTFDTGARGHGTGSGDLSSGNFTAAAADFIYACGNKNAGGGLTQGTGMTLITTGSTTGYGSAYKILGAGGTTAGLLHNATSVDYDVFGVGLQPSGAAPTNSNQPLTMTGVAALIRKRDSQ